MVDNNLLHLTLVGEYSIKELTETEFQSRTHYESDHESLTNLFTETMSKTDGTTLHSIKKKAEELLNRLNGVRRSFGIYFSDQYVGYISFANYDSKNPEIQIELSEVHRNKGIGFRALSLLTNRIFEEKQDIEYFVYCVMVDNIASIRLIEKLGGKKIETGHFIEQIISKYHILRAEIGLR